VIAFLSLYSNLVCPFSFSSVFVSKGCGMPSTSFLIFGYSYLIWVTTSLLSNWMTEVRNLRYCRHVLVLSDQSFYLSSFDRGFENS
jgi:hypothetical protein